MDQKEKGESCIDVEIRPFSCKERMGLIALYCGAPGGRML